MLKTQITTQGQRIRYARLEHGLSQKKLAEELGITQQAIARYECDERGNSNPNIGTLKKISSILHVSMEYILTGKSEENKNILSDVHYIPVIQWSDLFHYLLGKGKSTMNIDACETIPLLNGLSEHCFGLRLNRAVMRTNTGPFFLEGEIIIVDTDLEAKVGDFVLVSIDDSDSIHFRQLIELEGREALQSDNLQFDYVTPNTVFHGVVVGSHRKFRN